MNKNAKEILNSFGEKDYKNRVNLHIHTVCSDGELTPEEVLNQAKKSGLEYISITDHHTLDAYKNIIVPEGLNLISGVEISCWIGPVLLHILGYGVDLDNRELRKTFGKQNNIGFWAHFTRLFVINSAKNVIKAIHNAGGTAILAHPACYWCFDTENMLEELKDYGLDGIEIYYPYRRHRSIIKFHSERKIKKISEKLGLIMTGGTDCHERVL